MSTSNQSPLLPQSPPVLHIQPLALDIRLQPGQTVLQALQEQGLQVDSGCDGKGTCGQCRVTVSPPQAVPKTPHPKISSSEAAAGVRLACQIRPDRDLDILLPPTYSMQAQAESSQGTILLGETTASTQFQPAVRLVSDRGRVWLQDREGGRTRLPDWPQRGSALGAAIDLGTTTLVVSLIDLEQGRELASLGRLNPQVAYGHDVLTRIERASSPEGLDLLASSVQQALNQMLTEVCAQQGLGPEQILDVVIGGNTTMLQICARIDPAPLGRMPFTVSLQSGTSLPGSRFGLNLHPRAQVYVPPIKHAFIGSDISAGLLVGRGFFHPQESTLFLDVGTNGEMAVSHGQLRLVTSTAAGPAFEGSGLTSGMRAATGAIQAVTCTDQDLELQVIGAGPPQGLCGSGLLDLVHTLLQLGMVDATGRLLRPEELSHLPAAVLARRRERDGQAAVALDNGVWLTQEDIRQLQLAKAAVRTGIDCLLHQAGLEVQGLDRIVIGGGFGNVLRPASLEGIGLLPPESAAKVIFAGNTSRTGCVQLVLDASLRGRLEREMDQTRHLPLAQDADFMDLFVQNMEFPDVDNQSPTRAGCGVKEGS